MESLLNEATVCRLACTDKSKPYIVPLSFGYHEDVISIHSANEGKKTTLLRKNPECCIEVDKCREVMKIGYPCNREMHYRNVICTGRAHFITGPEEKQNGLNCIMYHYGAESHPLS